MFKDPKYRERATAATKKPLARIRRMLGNSKDTPQQKKEYKIPLVHLKFLEKEDESSN